MLPKPLGAAMTRAAPFITGAANFPTRPPLEEQRGHIFSTLRTSPFGTELAIDIRHGNTTTYPPNLKLDRNRPHDGAPPVGAPPPQRDSRPR
jgi:hypothetical protein